MGRRQGRAWLVALTVLVLLGVGGCGSAADIASSDRPGKQSPRPGGKQSSPTTPRSSSPTPTKKSTSAPPRSPNRQRLPNVVGAVRVFLTPSRNIGCRVSADGARCDIRQHVYREPTRPGSCHGDYGQSLAVSGSDVAAFVCVTDTVIAPGARVLRYGTSTIVGDFGCTSRITGIRCLSLTSRHGFHLSQASPTLF